MLATFICIMLLHRFSILRVTAATAVARLSHRNSVRPSVRHTGWISQKRCKLWSPNLHHRLPGRL